MIERILVQLLAYPDWDKRGDNDEKGGRGEERRRTRRRMRRRIGREYDGDDDNDSNIKHNAFADVCSWSLLEAPWGNLGAPFASFQSPLGGLLEALRACTDIGVLLCRPRSVHDRWWNRFCHLRAYAGFRGVPVGPLERTRPLAACALAPESVRGRWRRAK